MKKLLSKIGFGISSVTNILLAQSIVLLADVTLMGLAIAMFDYGNKWLFVVAFVLGMINKRLINLVRGI